MHSRTAKAVLARRVESTTCISSRVIIATAFAHLLALRLLRTRTASLSFSSLLAPAPDAIREHAHARLHEAAETALCPFRFGGSLSQCEKQGATLAPHDIRTVHITCALAALSITGFSRSFIAAVQPSFAGRGSTADFSSRRQEHRPPVRTLFHATSLGGGDFLQNSILERALEPRPPTETASTAAKGNRHPTSRSHNLHCDRSIAG